MEIMKSCKFKSSKISRLSRDNNTKSPRIRDGNFPEKSREIPSGNPGRETLVICFCWHYAICQRSLTALLLTFWIRLLLHREDHPS